MSYRVIVQSRARRDLIRLGDFLVSDNPRAALAAVTAIEAGLRSLVRFPERAAEQHGVRSLIIPFGQSGYVARYRIVGAEVFVERVLHMREDRSAP